MFWNKVLALAAYDNSKRRIKMRRVSNLSWLVRWLVVVSTTALLVSGLLWPIPTAGAQSGAITGTVKDPNGSAVANARVEVYNQNHSVHESSNTDEQGIFRIGGLPSGTYTLRANSPGEGEGSQYTGSMPQAVTVSEGSANDVGVVMLTEAQITGKVTLPDGATGVARAWVNAHSEDWSIQEGSNSDDQGNFRIGGLPSGTYLVRAEPPPDPVYGAYTRSDELSAWSKANKPLRKGGPYCLQAKVFHTDGTKKNYRICFAKRTHSWQYRKKTFTVDKDYSKIVVYLLYYKQGGEAWFDEVQLIQN